MKYQILRLLLSTIGQLSDGIRLGWQKGFSSGLMLDYIYQNEARGITPVGRLFDRMFLDHEVWASIRNRRALLIDQLNEAISKYNQPHVFDMAAGMGSYLFQMPRDVAFITAGEYDPVTVETGRAKAHEHSRTDIEFKQSDAFSQAKLATQNADILVCSGFFDILIDDSEIDSVIKNGSAITEKGARWVFTIQEHHPDLQLLKESLIDFNKQAWQLVPRTAEVLTERAKQYGWKLEQLQRNEFFAIGTLVKA